jgi:hypothetical protein
MSFLRHKKIYQSDEPKGGRTEASTSLGDHRSDESSAGYSFLGCSPAVPTSASPAATSFSHYPAAVNCSAAKRNLSPFSLSQPRGPLQGMFARPHMLAGNDWVNVTSATPFPATPFPLRIALIF